MGIVEAKKSRDCTKMASLNSPLSTGRKALYKPKGPWSTFGFRETLKKRCKERLKEDRHRLLQKYRGLAGSESVASQHTTGGSVASSPATQLVEDVMMSQWEGMQDSFQDLPPCEVFLAHRKRKREVLSRSCHGNSDYEDLLDDVPQDFNEMVSLFEELTKELIREEEEILRQYEKDVLFSEEALCAAIDTLTTDDVICPICQKNILHESHRVIFCSCGFRLDTGFGGVTLKYMKTQLDDGCSEHSATCPRSPLFFLDKTAGVDNLLMKCQVCGFLYVIV